MEEKIIRKLTEEERQKVNYVLNDFFSIYKEEPSDPEYITEYDILMELKEDEFKLLFLNDNEPSRIDDIMEMCEKYIKEKENQEGFFGVEFGLIMEYDMWINECPFWPTNNPKLWKRWDKLKKIKVKRRNS